MRINSINLMIFIFVPLALWLGFSDRVDWWVIILIFLFNTKILYSPNPTTNPKKILRDMLKNK